MGVERRDKRVHLVAQRERDVPKKLEQDIRKKAIEFIVENQSYYSLLLTIALKDD